MRFLENEKNEKMKKMNEKMKNEKMECGITGKSGVYPPRRTQKNHRIRKHGT